MGEIRFQRARLDDVEELRRISTQTFLDAYAASNSVENMSHYMAESFSESRLSEELNDKNSEFYFARTDCIIGYLKINFNAAQTELHDAGALEIERIYVLQEYYGKGAGQRLMEFAKSIAVERGIQRIWLGVWEENERAIRFYTKNGFTAFGRHIFKLGDDNQWDVMMELSLNP
jgi:ribosomal protein S18 acetylase RimI-like enzyme